MKKHFIFLSILLISIPVLADDTNLFSPKGIAEVYITLLDGKTIDDIKKDEIDADAVKLEATMVIQNSGTSSYSASELYNGKIEIKGRGNTTWGVPKKPYSIDLITDNKDDNPSGLLGMPADEEWVLLAFWHDRSLMRIPLASYLGRSMSGLEYTPRLRYVEVYINGDYRGIYTLCESIKRGKDRVDIAKLTADASDQVEPNISGGYIVEVKPTDRVENSEKNTQFQTTVRNINYVFKYPKPKNATAAEVQWINKYISDFETVLYGTNYKDTVNGYLKYINENSFIDWYILHDLSKGVDNLFHASIFIHKDRNGKLNMSAPWDFDLSFGNVSGDCYYEDELWIQKTQYFNRLMQDDRFAKKLIARYDELQPLLGKIPTVLAANLQQLRDAGCIDRDFKKWPQILGDYKDNEGRTTPTTVEGHVRWFKEWLESRKTWLYINYGLTDVDRSDRLKKSKPIIRIMNPENFEAGGSSDVKVMRGYTYIWNDTYTTTNENYQINKDGKYWVQIRDATGNTSLPSKSIARGEADEDETAVQQVNYKSISIYPSSVKDVLFINYQSEKDAVMNIFLFDMQGTLARQADFNVVVGANQYEFKMPAVSNGIYLIKCVTGREIISRKIIVSN